MKKDDVISLLEKVYGHKLGENYVNSICLINKLEPNDYKYLEEYDTKELNESMIYCIYNQKKKIEQLEEIISKF